MKAMDILLLLAIVCFLSGAVVAAIHRSWVNVLICAGLCLVVLARTGLID